jgi:hypothetical protein
MAGVALLYEHHHTGVVVGSRAAAVWRNACGVREAAPDKESLTDVVGYATMVNGILRSIHQNVLETLPSTVSSYGLVLLRVRQFTEKV